MTAVGCTVRDRVMNPAWWGNDYASVIEKKDQYSSLTTARDLQLTYFPPAGDPRPPGGTARPFPPSRTGEWPRGPGCRPIRRTSSDRCRLLQRLPNLCHDEPRRPSDGWSRCGSRRRPPLRAPVFRQTLLDPAPSAQVPEDRHPFLGAEVAGRGPRREAEPSELVRGDHVPRAARESRPEQ